MSRAYRIRVRESLRQVIRASDHVSTRLELLPVLPAEQMGGLLAEQLQQAGFREQGGKWTRTEGDLRIVVDCETGEVTVAASQRRSLELEASKEGRAFDDIPRSRQQVEEALRGELRKSMQQEADQQNQQLQRQVTDQLEASLGDVRRELDLAVNKATAAALKIKASQLGQIQKVTEDAATGAVTIVVEV